MRHKWLYAGLTILVVALLTTLAQAMFTSRSWFRLQDDDTYTRATWEAWNAAEAPYGQGYAFGPTGLRSNNYWTRSWSEADNAFDRWYDSGASF
jgi:hypothetical protein